MRRLNAGMTVLLIYMGLFARVDKAYGQESGSCSIGPFSAQVDCGGSVSSVAPTGRQAVGVAIGGAPSSQVHPPNSVTLPMLNDVGGLPCVGFQTIGTPAPLSPDRRTDIQEIVDEYLTDYALCPEAGVPAPEAVNPAVLAAKFWETIPLPVPKPTVPPGYAITGKPAYLVTNGTVAPPAYQQQTVVGALHITAHGSYGVSWGDGSVTGPYATEGLAYPNGNIAHTYDNVGTDTVRVTETWTATWSLGKAGGTLQALHTQGAINDFPIRQLQAVITG
jgi:hypothetical protein